MTAHQRSDSAAVARWSEDAEYARFLGFYGASRPQSQAELEREYDEALKQADQDNSTFTFAFRTLADDKLIGTGHLWIGWVHQIAWVGIGIGESDYRSKGYGTDALRLMIGYAFRELNLHRIELEVLATNARAIRSYQKVGFQHEATERSAVYRDGQRIDVLIMGLLRREWDAQHKAIGADGNTDQPD